MIVGTAGHIDHGKTSLVKALTGVDTDRLKEEKERGITVDLGFAYQAIGTERLGFVDVPGHEKLVRNMLAGATGMDHVMLVVAADDGAMPQTLEHLAIIDLLGLSRGVVVLTKADLVDEPTLLKRREQLTKLLAPTCLQDAPVLSVSSTTGQGMSALRDHLQSAAKVLQASRTQEDARFRLAIDRSFSLSGIGTVVTGTATAGSVRVGDRLVVSPRGSVVRVRGLHAHNQVSEVGVAGQRLALNVTGVEKSDVHRGDWLVDEALHAPTSRIDARLRLLDSEPKSLAHWTPVHLHLGAEDVVARVVMLEGRSIEPGQSARVRLELDRPIGALHGDRFILRDQSAARTLGGGHVLDIFAPDSRRRKAQRLAALTALEHPAPEDRLKALLEVEVANGVDAARLGVLWNLSASRLATLIERVPHRALGADAQARLFAPGCLERYGQGVSAKLADHHAQHPDSPGLTQEQLMRAVTNKPALKVFEALLKDLAASRVLSRTGAHWHLPSHSASLQGAEKLLWERIKPWLDEGGIHPPKLSDLLLRDRNLRKDQVLRVLQRLARLGQVHAVGDEYFIQTHHVLKLALVAKELADRDPNRRLNVKELREATGMSRHLSLPLVEFFDKIGYTHRDEVGRHIRRDPHRMFGMPSDLP